LVDTAGLTYSVNLRRAVKIQIDRRHKSTNDRESVKKNPTSNRNRWRKRVIIIKHKFYNSIEHLKIVRTVRTTTKTATNAMTQVCDKKLFVKM